MAVRVFRERIRSFTDARVARACEATGVIFDRILCGVDPSEESMEAVRQADRLVSSSGKVVLVSVVEFDLAVHAGWAAGDVLDELRSESASALDRARSEIASLRDVETRLLQGPTLSCFRDEMARAQPTLVVLGTHGHRRATGILLGTVTATLLHEAPCSVLVARAVPDRAAFPSGIVVGVDGSREADTAAAVAGSLAERFGASVRTITASSGKTSDTAVAGASNVEVVSGKPVEVLVAASAEADLLVIGSRGLHGVKALGSVSERVAHEARCSVLVVR